MKDQRRRYWSKLVAKQEASGQKARPFCRERGIPEYSFYKWRRRLRQAETVEFALLETAPATVSIPESALELIVVLVNSDEVDKLEVAEQLLHEMAHAATNGDHGDEWNNEMRRLKQAGAPVLDFNFD